MTLRRVGFGDAAVAGHERCECDDAGYVFVDIHPLLERVAVGDIPGSAIDGRTADPVDQKRRFRPEGRAFDGAATGQRFVERRRQLADLRQVPVDLGGRTALRMIATGRILNVYFDSVVDDDAADDIFEFGNGRIELFSGQQFADQRQPCFAWNGDIAAAGDFGDEQKGASD